MFPPVPAYLPPPGGAGLRNNAVNASIACKITPFNVMYTVNNIRHTIIVYCKKMRNRWHENLSQFIEIHRTHKIVTLKPSRVRYRYFPGGCPPWTPARHASSSCAAGCTATILHAQYFLPVGCSRLRRHRHSILYLPAAAGHRRALQQGFMHAFLYAVHSSSATHGHASIPPLVFRWNQSKPLSKRGCCCRSAPGRLYAEALPHLPLPSDWGGRITPDKNISRE